ncbi:helix-turn-helix domain-containing protein [Bacteroides salyersiae]|uniref:helix-turn-helix domain-containing protein n=1 Tax=Bacteroides salyersiae TaxID=291644 RepID=UPI001C8B56C9|nr:helix-turn-helix domain-containing protein [Bacteroides salyersiae]
MANKQPNSKSNKRELSWMDQEEMSKSTHIYNYFIELLTSMRTVCHLSQCAAADIIHIDRSQLVKYENKETALTLKRFIHIYNIYSVYIIEHHIKLDERTKRLSNKCRNAMIKIVEW